MIFRNFILTLLLGTLAGHSSLAIRPIVHYHDLVAGEGDQGFRDGPFQSALFNTPQGLAINPEGTELYVADKENHCIRVVHLEENNRVETLAGSGMPGYLDGPLEKALFKEPTALAFLSGNRLAVYDSGNSLIRLVDLNEKRVTTLPLDKAEDGKVPDIPAKKVWNLLYNPADDSLYFSQPDFGALRRIDLKTGMVHTTLHNDAHIPRPGALCLFQNHLCVANREGPLVFQVDFSSNSAMAATVTLLPAKGAPEWDLLALAPWGPNLYALHDGNGTAWARLVPGGPFNVQSIWGQYLANLINFGREDCAGFVPDPKQERRFYLTCGQRQNIISLKDYYFDINKTQGLDARNAVGLSDFTYPDRKPPHTFRILVVGDSLSFSYSPSWEGFSPDGPSIMPTMPKRLELMLNTAAAMDDVPMNYEVLDIGHGYQGYPSFLWPYYVVPALVKRFDIDLVLYVFATVPAYGYNSYFLYPLNKDGIPTVDESPEYFLKPWKEKIPKGVPEDFYRKSLAKGWVTEKSKWSIEIQGLNTTLKDKDVRDDLLELVGKPMGLLREKLDGLQTSGGKSVQLQMVLILARYGPGTLDLYRDFWKTVAEKQKIPYLDLIDDFIIPTPTFFPLEDDGELGHYTGDGCLLYAYIMAHELIRHQIIPYPGPSTPPQTKPAPETP
jgi:hypothetical protein